MAATNILVLNPGDKTFLKCECIGDGAIAAGDTLVTDLITYPMGSTYFDRVNKIQYRRIAEAKAIGDWWKSAAYVTAP